MLDASLIAPVVPALEPEPPLLHEERVRDQLSAAEELHYVGHDEPAMIAAGAALGGVLRLRAAALAGSFASPGALLEAMLATGIVTVNEHELLDRLLRAHSRMTIGYAPDFDLVLTPDEITAALALMVQLLEGLHQPSSY